MVQQICDDQNDPSSIFYCGKINLIEKNKKPLNTIINDKLNENL